MSDWTSLGPVPDIDGNEVFEVSRHVSGVIALNCDEWTVALGPEGQAVLREALDRSAMTGQAEGRDHG